ncbi:MAG TPA: hypothetical protein VEY51_00335 [Chondromyces sp.]|nr:hypothetical protein [Chondromyces sp.]
MSVKVVAAQNVFLAVSSSPLFIFLAKLTQFKTKPAQKKGIRTKTNCCITMIIAGIFSPLKISCHFS